MSSKEKKERDWGSRKEKKKGEQLGFGLSHKSLPSTTKDRIKVSTSNDITILILIYHHSSQG